MTNIFMKVLSMSITGCYVILAILVMRALIRKTPKKFSYALWIAAAFRLCCPISFESLISLFNFGAKSVPQVTYTVAEHTGNAAVKAASTITSAATSVTPPVVSSAVTETVTSAATEAAGIAEQASRAVGSVARVPQRVPTLTTGFSRIDETIRRGAAETVNKTVEAGGMTTYEKVLLIFTVVWILGMVGFLAYGIVNDLKIRKRVQKAIRDEKNVYYCDEISSPFLFGIFRPRIYIPFGMEESEKEYILAHEKYHLKRKDHIVKLAAYFILMVHWFNPLVWVGFILMNKDLEMSCDEKIISGNQEIKKAYSTSLLSFATGKRTTSPVSLSFGESSVKERVENTLKWRKPKLWISVIAVITCIVTLVACVSNPTTKPEKIIDENGVKTLGQFAGTTVVKKKDGNVIAKHTMEKHSDDCSEYTYEYVYDSKGNILRVIENDINGQVTGEYLYDENGNIDMIIYTDSDGVQGTKDYSYDENGNVIIEQYSSVYYGTDEKFPPDGMAYVYDDNGNVIKEWGEDESYNEYEYNYEYEYDENGVVKARHKKTSYVRYFEYEYDEQGRIIKKIKPYFNGEKDITEYEYDDQGNVINEINTDSSYMKDMKKYHESIENSVFKYDYQIDHGCENEYDEEGKLIREVFPNVRTSRVEDAKVEKKYEYNEHGDIVKEVMNYINPPAGYVVDEVTEYDRDGKEIKKVQTYLNGQQSTTVYVYDSEGRLLEELGPNERIVNEYDEDGNLIKKTEKNGTYTYTIEYSGYVYFDKEGIVY